MKPKGNRPKKGSAGKPSGESNVSPSIQEMQLQHSTMLAALGKLVSHGAEQSQVISRLAASKGGGAFSSLGGDVDSMIEHGQEAYALVKKLLNVETKEYAVGAAGVAINYTGTALDVTSYISQGATDITRNGDSIKIVRLIWSGMCNFNTASTSTIQPVRILVTRSNDEALVGADLFSYISTAYTPFSPVTWDTKAQFKVLYDRVLPLCTTHIGQAFHVELEDLGHTQYSAGTTTVESGCVQLWWVTNEGTANFPVITYALSLQFVDN